MVPTSRPERQIFDGWRIDSSDGEGTLPHLIPLLGRDSRPVPGGIDAAGDGSRSGSVGSRTGGDP